MGRESELEALGTDGGFLPFLGNSRKYKILVILNENLLARAFKLTCYNICMLCL